MNGKAILVIDMPKRCNECYLLDEPYDLCMPTNEDVSDYQSETKPSWCPLKELPQKITSWKGKSTNYQQGHRDGYNACIDEILKVGAK